MTLVDTSPMPHGKHKGTPMANVPAQYLLWLYYNKATGPDVIKYIEQNIEDLKKEAGIR